MKRYRRGYLYLFWLELEIRVSVVQYQIRVLESLISVVVLQVVERMVVPDPWFDDHTPISLSRGLKEFLDPWSNLLVDQGIQVPEVVLVVR
jgi:hypothetical protein